MNVSTTDAESESQDGKEGHVTASRSAEGLASHKRHRKHGAAKYNVEEIALLHNLLGKWLEHERQAGKSKI